MEVKFKKLHPDAVLPSYAKPGDAGLDLTAVGREHTQEGGILYPTGLAVEIPEGYVGLIFPRSSIYQTVLSLTNAVGVIDSGYRGEICFRFRCHLDDYGGYYMSGDRIGQLVILPYPQIQVVEASELSETERGEGGFGSTGK